jgi:hypothetical protein
MATLAFWLCGFLCRLGAEGGSDCDGVSATVWRFHRARANQSAYDSWASEVDLTAKTGGSRAHSDFIQSFWESTKNKLTLLPSR